MSCKASIQSNDVLANHWIQTSESKTIGFFCYNGTHFYEIYQYEIFRKYKKRSKEIVVWRSFKKLSLKTIKQKCRCYEQNFQ